MLILRPQMLRNVRQIAKALYHRLCCRILSFCQLGVGRSLFVFCHIGFCHILAGACSTSVAKAAKSVATEKLFCEWLLFAALATYMR